VITIEPGVYFIPALLHDPEVRRKHRGRVDFAKAETYLALGGVRIEDMVLVTGSGVSVLTTLPRELQ